MGQLHGLWRQRGRKAAGAVRETAFYFASRGKVESQPYRPS